MGEMQPLRTRVQAKTYRGQPGFLVSGRSADHPWGVSVFCRTEEGAREIQAAYCEGGSSDAIHDLTSDVLRGGR